VATCTLPLEDRAVLPAFFTTLVCDPGVAPLPDCLGISTLAGSTGAASADGSVAVIARARATALTVFFMVEPELFLAGDFFPVGSAEGETVLLPPFELVVPFLLADADSADPEI
jgi:hypothetical protein